MVDPSVEGRTTHELTQVILRQYRRASLLQGIFMEAFIDMWRVCGIVGRYASTHEALGVDIRWRMELRIPFLTH